MLFEFADNLKKLRTEYKKTQRDIADKLNVTEQAVSKWEKGSSLPDIQLLPIIAEFFDVSIDFLLTGKENIKYVEVSNYDACHEKVVLNMTEHTKLTRVQEPDSYNGIENSKVFPPTNMGKKKNYDALPVPYLTKPPKTINISVGRQLFVDDFLIESTNMVREYHKPIDYGENPVFFPETKSECGIDGHCAMAAPFSDGVWYDGEDKKFKMWYNAGWFDGTAYAESDDGINWKRAKTDYEDSRVFPYKRDVMRDSSAVVVDNYNKDVKNKYKMFLFSREKSYPTYEEKNSLAEIFDSVDGIHWNKLTDCGKLGDRSTIFYNPFRKKWVYSIRAGFKDICGRARMYCEGDSLEEAASLKNKVLWTRADKFDKINQREGYMPTLYNLDAVAYESVLLGAFCIFTGPENNICETTGIPKETFLTMGYSRNGFHWYRTDDRTPFIAPDRDNKNSYKRGYIHSNNAICIINGDELWFYYTAFRGDEKKINLPPHANGMYANATTCLAKLRRDGFASMNASFDEKVLLTRTLEFSGKYFFINADARYGRISVEILDESGKTIRGYSVLENNTMSGNSTKYRVTWREKDTLEELEGKKIKIRFVAVQTYLYSFWITDSIDGNSHGYLAGGEKGKRYYIDE